MGVPAAMGTRFGLSGRKSSPGWKKVTRAHSLCLAAVQNIASEKATAGAELGDTSARQKLSESALNSAAKFSISTIGLPDQFENIIGGILSDSNNVHFDGGGNSAVKYITKKGSSALPSLAFQGGSLPGSPRSDGLPDGAESPTSVETEGTGKIVQGKDGNLMQQQHGNKGGAEDWWSEAESEPISEVPTEANYMSDSTSICTAISVMDADPETKPLQEKRSRNRVVSSRYKTTTTRPPSAPKRYPTPLLGQAKQADLPLPRATSTERKRSLNKERSSVSRATAKPGLAQNLPGNVGLWARTNSSAGYLDSSVDARNAESNTTPTKQVTILESKRPSSVRKGSSWGLDQDAISMRGEVIRENATGGNGMVSNVSRRGGRGVKANGPVTGRGATILGPEGPEGRLLLERDRAREQGQEQLRERARGTGSRAEVRRIQMPNNRLVGSAMSRSVDLSSSESDFPGNRRNTFQEVRSRSTSRAARLSESQSMTSSMIEDMKVSGRATGTVRTPNNRFAAGRASFAGAGKASMSPGGGMGAGREGTERGVMICTPSGVVDRGNGAVDRGTRRLHVRSNSDVGFRDVTSVPSGRGEGSGGLGDRSRRAIREPDGGGSLRLDERVDGGTNDRAGTVDEVVKMNRGATSSNRDGRYDSESVSSVVSSSRAARDMVRSRTWDSSAWRQGIAVEGEGMVENHPRRENSSDAREPALRVSSLLGRPGDGITAQSNNQPNGAVVLPKPIGSPWRPNPLSGNNLGGPALWTLSPSRIRQQQLAVSSSSSPPPSPTARSLLLAQPPAGGSPLSTPPRAGLSPGPRPRSAYADGGKVRSMTSAPSPTHQPASSSVPAPLVSQPPVSSMSPQMLARHVRVLHNRWLQWRFINAKQEALVKAQQNLAETALYSAWAATAELRSMVTLQRIKLQRAKQARKLDSVLSAHAMRLEEWSQIKQEHTAAFGGAIEALEAAMLRVPLVNGAKADVGSLTLALATAGEIIDAVSPSVARMLPKVESTESLLSQLAEVVAGERALLEECGELLSYAALLETEERSLRAHRLQLAHERERTQEGGGMSASLGASELAMGSSHQ